MSEDLVKRATRSYFRRFGGGAPIPSDASRVEMIRGEQIVVLRDINGDLAKYKIDRGGKLRLVTAQAIPAWARRVAI